MGRSRLLVAQQPTCGPKSTAVFGGAAGNDADPTGDRFTSRSLWGPLLLAGLYEPALHLPAARAIPRTVDSRWFVIAVTPGQGFLFHGGRLAAALRADGVVIHRPPI